MFFIFNENIARQDKRYTLQCNHLMMRYSCIGILDMTGYSVDILSSTRYSTLCEELCKQFGINVKKLDSKYRMEFVGLGLMACSYFLKHNSNSFLNGYSIKTDESIGNVYFDTILTFEPAYDAVHISDDNAINLSSCGKNILLTNRKYGDIYWRNSLVAVVSGVYGFYISASASYPYENNVSIKLVVFGNDFKDETLDSIFRPSSDVSMSICTYKDESSVTADTLFSKNQFSLEWYKADSKKFYGVICYHDWEINGLVIPFSIDMSDYSLDRKCRVVAYSYEFGIQGLDVNCFNVSGLVFGGK